MGYLSKKVLATEYAESGNNKAAGEILDSMLKDPKCQLPKEDLSLQLSRVLVAQGKRAEAIKLLREATLTGSVIQRVSAAADAGIGLSCKRRPSRVQKPQAIRP